MASHALVLQSTQITAMASPRPMTPTRPTPTPTLPTKINLSNHRSTLCFAPLIAVSRQSRTAKKKGSVVRGSSTLEVGGDSIVHLERCFTASPDSNSAAAEAATAAAVSTFSSSGGAVMKGQYGAFGAVTLEKSKLDMAKPQTKFTPESGDQMLVDKDAIEHVFKTSVMRLTYFSNLLELVLPILVFASLFYLQLSQVAMAYGTAIGGGGGDIGKKIYHGGGDGGDDGGDDDDYFGDFDDFDEGDEGGLFRKRLVLQELFDRKFVDAVLNEWQKTMMDLPAGLRQAYEMGLVSSAQMVRFLAINARPTTARFISRALPQSVSRAFIGRMIADPAFLYKFCLEQAATVGCSVWWELKSRKERIKEEWDLALINVLTVSACNAVVVWSLAPCRSYGNVFQFDLQNTIQKLPNNIFEMSYPQRSFDLQKRIQSFLYKAAELCMVGLTAGAAQGAVDGFCLNLKMAFCDRVSVTIPTASANALGYGAFLGLYANLRHQLLYGIDRAMINHFDVIGVALFFSTVLRVMNLQVGETSRRAWLGVEVDPLVQSENLLKAYNRPSEAVAEPSSSWVISKNAIVSGLGLLGIKQGSNDQAATPATKRRKRIVRKKVTAAST
ncbi:hypothetical protein Sjap_021512 [Stephania japonica]|uniref:Protein RETICULATA-RELATED 1, chloroplastic n=1 Tax=Stephania japonica TaxID=461633 RepID=A0AAP0HU66_9MAGN